MKEHAGREPNFRKTVGGNVGRAQAFGNNQHAARHLNAITYGCARGAICRANATDAFSRNCRRALPIRFSLF